MNSLVPVRLITTKFQEIYLDGDFKLLALISGSNISLARECFQINLLLADIVKNYQSFDTMNIGSNLINHYIMFS